MRKVSQAWSLVVFVIALLAAGCASDAPTTSPTALPAHGTPSKIELSAMPGTGEHGGTATVTARVLDAYALLLPDVDVTFSADAGTLEAASVTTNANGVATTALTAAPGTVKVHATAGAVQAPEAVVAIQPVNVFVPPPVVPPPVVPSPPAPPLPPSVPQPPSYTVSIAASPASVTVGTPTTLTATVGLISGASAPTTWAWDCDGNGTTDAITANTASCTYLAAGTFTAKLTVTGGSVTGSGTKGVTVTAAPVPSYTVALVASPATIAAGGSTTLTATVARVNGASPPTSWEWDCDTSTPPLTDFTSPISATCTYPNAGIFIAKVTVSNGTGVSGAATVDVNVTPAAPPPLLVTVAPTVVAPVTLATIHVGDTVTFTATASSTSPLPVSVNWEWDDDNNGIFETVPTAGATPTNTRPVVMLVSGVWKARVRVTDPATGRTASATSQVTVLP
jgi:PKD repeat protein